MDIRPETSEDCEAIHALTEIAFDPMPFSDGTEAACIEKLRADGDLKLSLVAIESGRLVGHVAFSPVHISDTADGWFGLGPVSVSPELQKAGIGSALINEGLGRLRAAAAQGCVLIGDPRYYKKFGFVGDGRLSYRELPGDVVQWLAFGAAKPSGTLRFSPGLE